MESRDVSDGVKVRAEVGPPSGTRRPAGQGTGTVPAGRGTGTVPAGRGTGTVPAELSTCDSG